VIVGILSAGLTISAYQIPIALTAKQPHLYRACSRTYLLSFRRPDQRDALAPLGARICLRPGHRNPIGLVFFECFTFEKAPLFFTGDITNGITRGILSAVVWAMAFTVAEWFGDSRSAIASDLVITIALNNPGKTWLIPFAVIWIAYSWMRRRSQLPG
jgi:hypothetical protein